MKYFTIKELCKSSVAEQNKINNTPNNEQEKNLVLLIEKLLDPIREAFGKPITVNSGFRCKELNEKVKGSKTSDHMNGCSADITSENNKELWETIMLLHERGIIEFDQLINEGKTDKKTGKVTELVWIHISYNKNRLRNQIFKLN